MERMENYQQCSGAQYSRSQAGEYSIGHFVDETKPRRLFSLKIIWPYNGNHNANLIRAVSTGVKAQLSSWTLRTGRRQEYVEKYYSQPCSLLNLSTTAFVVLTISRQPGESEWQQIEIG